MNILDGILTFVLVFFTCSLSSSSTTTVMADFICDFEANHTCGYEWQPNLLPFALVDHIPWLGTSGMMLLDLKVVNHTIAPGGRLITRYYPTYAMSYACLTVKFLTFGPGINRFAIIQRNNQDRRIFEYDNDWHPSQQTNRLDQYWITLTIPVDLIGGDVMFFLEVTTDGHTPNGLFALDHVAFLYYKCPFKQMPHYPCLDQSCAQRRI